MSNPLSESQRRILANVPHFSGALSFIGSMCIIIGIYRSNEKLSAMKTYDKLMVLLSLSDILSSASYFCSTWPIPQGHSTVEGGATVYQAYGNKTTCNIQGFISQYATIVPFYNAMLALNYLLLVKFGVNDDEMRRKYEPFMIFVPFIFALSFAVTGLAYDMYGPIGFW